MNKARCDIAEYLRKQGPLVSSEVSKHLQATCGISAEAARQRIRRAPHPVMRLTDIGLPDGASFLFHSIHKNSEFFCQQLAAAFINCNCAVGAALLSIRGRGGYIHEDRFASLSGAPVGAVAGHLAAKKILSIILKADLLQEAWKDDIGIVYSANFISPIPAARYRAICHTEKILSDIIVTWLTRLNFCVGPVSRLSGGQPACNGLDFDIVGKANLRHFFSDLDGKSTAFAVCDINVANSSLSTDNVEYFVKKVGIASYSRSRQNIMPFIFGYDFTSDCIAMLKKHGIIHARIKHIFGDVFAELLQNLCSMLGDFSAMLRDNQERLNDIIGGLLKVEGRTQNLRSVAFQSFVAQLYYNKGYLIEIDKRINPPSGNSIEIDVYAERADEIHCIECKAMLPTNNCPSTTLRSWIDNRLLRLIEWKRFFYGDKKTVIIFWVTTDYVDLGEIVLPKFKGDIDFRVYSGKDIVAALKAARLDKTLAHFNEHFVKGYS